MTGLVLKLSGRVLPSMDKAVGSTLSLCTHARASACTHTHTLYIQQYTNIYTYNIYVYIHVHTEVHDERR